MRSRAGARAGNRATQPPERLRIETWRSFAIVANVKARRGSRLSAPNTPRPASGRIKRALGDVGGLTQFGVNLVTLEPGVSSSLRHWHRVEDEFIYVLQGELALVTDAGEELLTAGMAAGFPGRQAQRASSRQSRHAHGYLSRSRHALGRRGGHLLRRRHDARAPRWREPSVAQVRRALLMRVADALAEGADPSLPLDAESLRRLELPPHAHLLGVRARGHRQERRLARAAGSRSRDSPAAILGARTATTRCPTSAASITRLPPGATAGGGSARLDFVCPPQHVTAPTYLLGRQRVRGESHVAKSP